MQSNLRSCRLEWLTAGEPLDCWESSDSKSAAKFMVLVGINLHSDYWWSWSMKYWMNVGEWERTKDILLWKRSATINLPLQSQPDRSVLGSSWPVLPRPCIQGPEICNVRTMERKTRLMPLFFHQLCCQSFPMLQEWRDIVNVDCVCIKLVSDWNRCDRKRGNGPRCKYKYKKTILQYHGDERTQIFDADKGFSWIRSKGTRDKKCQEKRNMQHFYRKMWIRMSIN